MRLKAWTIAVLMLSLTGCEALSWCASCGSRHAHNASSLVQFLYPRGDAPHDTGVPQLNLPLRVGLAFLPPQGEVSAVTLDAPHQEFLLEKVRQRFLSRHFIADIVIIPDYYLKQGQGFQGLEGVQRLYHVDLMALVSYDQVSHQNDNGLSLTYLTVVGAYIFNGTRDEVATLVDLAVVDPKTRSLVLRAGGVDSRHSNSTLIEQGTRLHKDEIAGFNEATLQMIDHFDAALTKFENDVKEGHANVQVARNSASKPSNGGGGGRFDLIALLALGVLLPWRYVSLTAARSKAVREFPGA
jgi:rhombotail lipoprotein